tara:strand:+ start:225 stop:689 length:465 start_codon:yes stop_codon:yes gene_type:complete
MRELEEWFSKNPIRKWVVGFLSFFVIVIIIISLRQGPDDAVEDYLTALSDMDYRKAASLHMNDDGSWMGNLDYWDDYFADGCGRYFSRCTVKDIDIKSVDRTGECVAYASDISIVTVSYRLEGSYVIEEYPVAKHDDGTWGIHLGGNFPNTFSC